MCFFMILLFWRCNLMTIIKKMITAMDLHTKLVVIMKVVDVFDFILFLTRFLTWPWTIMPFSKSKIEIVFTSVAFSRVYPRMICQQSLLPLSKTSISPQLFHLLWWSDPRYLLKWSIRLTLFRTLYLLDE